MTLYKNVGESGRSVGIFLAFNAKIEAISTMEISDVASEEKEMKVLTLSGFAMDNQSRQLGDINIYAPIHHYGIVESIHNLLLQQIVDFIMERENRE